MILIASTIAPHKLSEGFALKWLEHYEAMSESVGGNLSVFLAAEIDGRGIGVYEDLYGRLEDVQAVVWTFSINKQPFIHQPCKITTPDRLIRICTGRNLAIEHAIQIGASHILYLDTDTEPTPDCLTKLLETGRELVFGHVPTYNLDGPVMPELPGDCRQHWSSAGFCMVSREVFRRVRWGHDPDDDKTDDPCFARDVEAMGMAIGKDWTPVTRHDVVGKHWPPSIVALENRGTDLLMEYTHKGR